MTDIYNKQKRSEIMSKVPRHNTAQEAIVRTELFKRGFRYRKNVPTLPGSPDIVLPKYKTAIFVHGCFWHAHQGCKAASIPKSRQSYWGPKISANAARDKRKIDALTSLGWRVIVVWQCEISSVLKKRQRVEILVSDIEMGRQDRSL